MAHLKCANLFAALNVPQLGRVVHAARGQQCALRVEAQANNFRIVTLKRVKAFAALRAPQFACLVKRSGRYFIAISNKYTQEFDYFKFLNSKNKHQKK